MIVSFFKDLCHILGITLQDGLKLFTKNNWIDRAETIDIPFMGNGLNKDPFNWGCPNVRPDNLYLTEKVADEITLRFRRFNPHLIALLKTRYKLYMEQYKKYAKRSRLMVWEGFTTEFTGEITAYKLSGSYINVCIQNVKFMDGDEDILADHIWLGIPKKYHKIIPRHGNKIIFTGTVGTYQRYDPSIEQMVSDANITLVPPPHLGTE